MFLGQSKFQTRAVHVRSGCEDCGGADRKSRDVVGALDMKIAFSMLQTDSKRLVYRLGRQALPDARPRQPPRLRLREKTISRCASASLAIRRDPTHKRKALHPRHSSESSRSM